VKQKVCRIGHKAFGTEEDSSTLKDQEEIKACNDCTSLMEKLQQKINVSNINGKYIYY
jgi:hypothetical protein